MLSLFRVFDGNLYFQCMNRLAIRISLIMGVVTVLLITGVQVYFVHQAFNQEDRQLNQNIQVALRSVTEQMSKFNKADLPFDNPIQRLKPDYYVVNINGFIDAEILEHFLISEFQRRGLRLDFEFGIYDCSTDEIVYGRFVSFGQGQKTKAVDYSFSKYSEYMYYFGIFFPGRTKFILNNLGVWYFFSFVLLLVLAFFIYSQIIILKQRQLAEIQKDFINNLTHELRTPLSSILMSSEVFAEQNLQEDPIRIQQYGNIIRSKTSDLISQIDRILRLSDQSLKRNFHPLQFDFIDLLNQVNADIRKRIDPMDGFFEYDSQHEKLMIHGDRLLIKQLLNNVLDNAIKYSLGEPKIRMILTTENHWARLIIEDQGIGIPNNYKQKVFNLFFRVPKGNVHNVKGYGLGLYHVRRVARLHKWKVKLTSKENEGTIFELRFRIK